MGTTVDIHDTLLREAKSRAAEKGTTLRAVLEEALRAWLASPSKGVPWEFRWRTEEGRTTGRLVHGGHIAALCVEHGVSELLTLDADFRRFPSVRSRNPFRESARG